jgi:hypothetical protein
MRTCSCPELGSGWPVAAARREQAVGGGGGALVVMSGEEGIGELQCGVGKLDM